jgi:glycosyltransferase involved in cell wall biosynthesis
MSPSNQIGNRIAPLRKMESPKVSIIIPAHNVEPWIRDTLRSVYAQRFADYDVVLVDDGSTDGTARVGRQFTGVRYIRQRHGGVCAARNTGIQNSTSPLIAFLDADDVWLENMLQELVPMFDDESVGLACGDMYLWDGTGPIDQSERKWRRRRRPDEHQDMWRQLLQRNFVSTSATVIRRSVLAKVGAFDESLSHAGDYDLWLRIARSGYRFRFVDHVVGVGRSRPGSLSSDWGRKCDAHLHIWRKLLTIPDLTAYDRKLIKRNRRVTKGRMRQAALSHLLGGQVTKARICFLKAFLYRPQDPRNLFGLVSAWVWPKVATSFAERGWLGPPVGGKIPHAFPTDTGEWV